MKSIVWKAVILAMSFCVFIQGLPVYAAQEEEAIIGAQEQERPSSSKKWYESTRLIAHALGIVDSKVGTNSKEAFLQSYNHGFNVLEADFAVTSDGTLVVRHDFDQDSYYTLEQVVKNGNTSMDINRYRQEKICFRYTPLTARDLLQLMAEHEGIYIVTDTKDTDAEHVTRDFQLLVADARALGLESILDRFIVQIYNDEMIDIVREIYPFPNWIYTLYQKKDPDYAQVADFCVEKGIDVVTLNYELVTPERVEILTDRGLTVFTHTVNSLLHMKKYVGYGVQGVYTDMLQPNELSYIGLAEKKNIEKKMVVNNRIHVLDCYPEDGKEYYSIHALAYLLMDTKDHFAITIDAEKKTISIKTGGEYTPTNTELLMTDGFGILRNTPFTLFVDGKEMDISSYEISGGYYYPLEEICEAMGIQVGWNGIFAMQEIVTENRQQ